VDKKRLKKYRDASDLAYKILMVIDEELKHLPGSWTEPHTLSKYKEDFWRELELMRNM
jgi:hypothetical protein